MDQSYFKTFGSDHMIDAAYQSTSTAKHCFNISIANYKSVFLIQRCFRYRLEMRGLRGEGRKHRHKWMSSVKQLSCKISVSYTVINYIRKMLFLLYFSDHYFHAVSGCTLPNILPNASLNVISECLLLFNLVILTGNSFSSASEQICPKLLKHLQQ